MEIIGKTIKATLLKFAAPKKSRCIICMQARVIPQPKQFSPVSSVNKHKLCPLSKKFLGSKNKIKGITTKTIALVVINNELSKNL